MDLQNYNPMYVLQQPERAPRYVVSAELWTELFHLLTAQGNHTAEAVKTLIDKLKIELWGPEAAQFIANASTMPSEAGTNVASQLLWLNNTIAQHKTSSDHDTRYYTKDELTQYLQGGDTSVGIEVFTIVSSDNGNGTFTYNNGTTDIVGQLTAEGYQVFTLANGTYDLGQNRVEAYVNDTLHRSAASGGLAEIAPDKVALTQPESAGAEITIKYYERISLGGEQSIVLSTIQPQQTANRSILWFKLL
jgi:hypothetical protein